MKNRLLLALSFLSLWTGGIGLRLYQLQVRLHEEYSSRAAGQQQRRVRLEAPRGTIYDARGRELAVSVEVDSAYAVPSEIKDLKATVVALAGVLEASQEELEELLAKDREFVWVARKLDRPVAETLRALALPGIYFLQENKRYYPFGKLAGQVLGYVGIDDKGLGGLESYYDDTVRGKPAWRTVLRDARHGILVRPDLSFTDAEPGQDLYLTLDASIQYLAEKELARMVRWSEARAGSVVILDPRDSSVLAMASFPQFDPNHFNSYPKWSWRNRAVEDAFEPGSTFKMITAAAALNHAVVRADDLFDCEQGGISLRDTYIGDHQPFRILNFQQVIAKSSNVGVIKTGLRLGERRFYQSIEAFGFGRPTGIDLPGESAGILRPFQQWSELATAYASFGQGISVTPLQLTHAFAALANLGRRTRPYIVSDVSGEPLHPRPEVLGTPIARSTVEVLVRILQSVVTEGTGELAAIPGYGVAGKTGTAQKAEGKDGYSSSRFVASFVGFAPAVKPRVVCLVLLDEPKRSNHGGDTAAPTFSSIVGQTLLYLGVPPERQLWPRPEAWIRPPRTAATRPAVGPRTGAM